MKKLFLITIILLFQSFHSFGDPNEKGIICKCIDKGCTLKKNGHYFSKNKVKFYYFKRDKDLIIIQNIENDNYSVTSNRISWNYNDTSYYNLNRKTLFLEVDYPIPNKQYHYRCNLYKGFHFNREINKLRRMYQIEYNEKIKDNKI